MISLLAALLVGANLTQGPHLTSAQINLNTSVERAGQRLLLQSNEPLAAITAAQVSVTPAAAATATVNASSIDVQFTDILEYNTAYTVNITDVKSISEGASSTFTYTFTTPDPNMYVLAPGASTGTGDAIMTTPLSGGDPVTVYSAPHIRRFVVFPTALVVNTVNDDGTDALTIVSLTGAAPIPVQVAGPGTITSLKASIGSNLFGYTFSPQPSALYPTQPDQLYAYDLTRGQDYTIPITGTDHEQLATTNWAFVPSSTSLVAQTKDNTLLLIDTVGEREGTSGAVTIGPADALLGFIPGTKTLISTNAGGTTATDFSKSSNPTTPFSLPTESAVTTVALDTASSSLQYDTTDSAHPGAVIRVTAGIGSSVLFTPTTVTGPVTAVCVAPNGKYAAIITKNQQVTFLTIGDGSVLSSTSGQQTNWCSSN